MIPTIAVAPGLALKLGWLVVDGCRNAQGDPALDHRFEQAIARARDRFAGREMGDDPVIAGMRRTFRACGVDPGRYRPSGEALARRAVKGQDLYRVSVLVDINNLCSLDTLLPFGSYDLDRVDGPVELRLGRAGEGYDGIAKPVRVEGRLTTADGRGPFGSPVADSARTCIREQTTRVLTIAYAPPETADPLLQSALDAFADLAREHCAATVSGRGILAGA